MKKMMIWNPGKKTAEKSKKIKKKKQKTAPTYPNIDKFLAVDTGGSCGWAYYADSVITSGVFNLVIRSTKKNPINYGNRYSRFYEALNQFKDAQAVFYENVVAHSGWAPAHSYGAYRGVLMLWCEDNNIPYFSFDVGTIKKHATGKGNSKKDLMIKEAQKYSKTITDDNEADAFWILDLARSSMNKGSIKCPKKKK